MGVGDQNVFDIFWVKPELLHAAQDQRLRIVGINCIDQNDSFLARQRPGRMKLAPDEV